MHITYIPHGAWLRLSRRCAGLVQSGSSGLATINDAGNRLVDRGSERGDAPHGKPEIMNADQGSQFTSIDFVKTLKDADIQISIDGKAAWRDNVFVEQLWRTIKYEEVYLRAYDSVSAVRESLRRYLTFYNTRRPHSSLDGQTPDQAYLNPSSTIPVAA